MVLTRSTTAMIASATEKKKVIRFGGVVENSCCPPLYEEEICHQGHAHHRMSSLGVIFASTIWSSSRATCLKEFRTGHPRTIF
jgi:hypothetical protein